MYATRLYHTRIEAPTLAALMAKLREYLTGAVLAGTFTAAQCLGAYFTERM